MFTYPFNFVQPIKPMESARPLKDTEGHQLFSELLSGRITCKLVNLSPLLIPDPTIKAYQECADDNKHLAKTFFVLRDKLAIPSTSLRGMIRSVCETLSGSCMSQLNTKKGNTHFGWRRVLGMKGTLQRKPGKIIDDHTIQEMDMVKLPEAAVKALSITDKATVSFKARFLSHNDYACAEAYEVQLNGHTWTWLNAVDPVKLKSIKGARGSCRIQVSNRNPNDKRYTVQIGGNFVKIHKSLGNDLGLNNNDQVVLDDVAFSPGGKLGGFFYALKCTVTLPGGRFKTAALRKEAFGGALKTGTAKVIKFKLKPGEPKNKWNDRIFVDKPGNPKWTISDNTIIEQFDKAQIGDGSGHQQKFKSGELIYFTGQSGKVTSVGAVAMYREWYRSGIDDILQSKPCQKLDKLCTTCRLFGMVQASKSTSENEVSGLAGRIRFSHAICSDENPGLSEFFPMRTLGEPKPKSFPLYLIDKGRSNDFSVDYDAFSIAQDRIECSKCHGTVSKGERFISQGSGNTIRDICESCARTNGLSSDDPFKPAIRGRKFYWHQLKWGKGQWQKHLEHKGVDEGTEHNPRINKITSQNATVKVLQEGALFEFTVSFENLSREELGLLCYALQLREPSEANSPYAHKLGLGRPLGMGSVRIDITNLQVDDKITLYSSLFSNAPSRMQQGKTDKDFIQECIALYKKAVVRAHNGKQFETIPGVAEFLQLLNTNNPEHEVRYAPANVGESSTKMPQYWNQRKHFPLLTPQQLMDPQQGERENQ